MKWWNDYSNWANRCLVWPHAKIISLEEAHVRGMCSLRSGSLGNLVKQCLKCLVFLFNRKEKVGENGQNRTLKTMVIKMKYPKSLTVLIFFVKSSWIINKKEKYGAGRPLFINTVCIDERKYSVPIVVNYEGDSK